MTDMQFEEGLRQALREALREITMAHPGEPLHGLALLTDDDLSTLSCSALTAAGVASSKYDDILFMPTDWNLQPASETFMTYSDELGRRSDGSTDMFRRHVDDNFGLLVRVMIWLRNSGLVDTSVFLSVLSTDPGDYLDSLETEAVRTLNTPDLVDARKRFVAKWATPR